MASPLFTIVLAGYQTEPYLPKALASIASQTFADFEALCYVEQSTDNSLEICREMAARDPRFKVATAPNILSCWTETTGSRPTCLRSWRKS